MLVLREFPFGSPPLPASPALLGLAGCQPLQTVFPRPREIWPLTEFHWQETEGWRKKGDGALFSSLSDGSIFWVKEVRPTCPGNGKFPWVTLTPSYLAS